MEHPIKMDDLGEKPTIFGNIHIHKKTYVRQSSYLLNHLEVMSLAIPSRWLDGYVGFWEPKVRVQVQWCV